MGRGNYAPASILTEDFMAQVHLLIPVDYTGTKDSENEIRYKSYVWNDTNNWQVMVPTALAEKLAKRWPKLYKPVWPENEKDYSAEILAATIRQAEAFEKLTEAISKLVGVEETKKRKTKDDV